MSLVNCKLEKSILKTANCGYTLQSVKNIYLANVADVTAIERTKPAELSGTTDCGVEAATITLASSAKWLKVEPSRNSASFTDTLNVIDAGGRYRTHAVSFSIAGDYTAQMGCNLDMLSLGEFIVVVELASGAFILLGSEGNGLQATVVTNTGAASATEFSGIQVEMSADVTVSAAPLSTEAITSLKANIEGVGKKE